MANKSIPIQCIREPDICLTEMRWLHICEAYIFLCQELRHNIPYSLKGYLIHRHWVDGDYSKILIFGTRTHQDYPLQRLPRPYLQLIEATRDAKVSHWWWW